MDKMLVFPVIICSPEATPDNLKSCFNVNRSEATKLDRQT